MTENLAKKRIQAAIRMVRPEVRRVLLEVWDPIGVCEEPGAQDEYDEYADHVVGQLFSGATDDEIADYLHRVATENMGLPHRRERAYPAVAALRRIKLPAGPV
jgi:hypothetical protein